MSYEGYVEFLCENGHYFLDHCYMPNPEKCPKCGCKIEWFNSVDQTNGADADIPESMPAETERFIEDKWKVDKYENLYVVEEFLFKPAENSRWRKYTYHEETEL